MSDRPRIMVVDDEARMCDSLKKLLSAEGYEVSTFMDGQKAISALSVGAGFDCVVTDIKMPSTDGLQILRAARSHDRLAPVILMTGYASLESAMEAVNQGAYDYLLKPIEIPHLKMIIERGLAQRRSEQDRLDLMSRLKRQNRLLRERMKELRALHLVGLSVSSASPLSKVLEQLLMGATQVTGADQGSLMLLNEEGDELSIRAAIGLPDDVVRETRLKLSEGISGYVASTGESVRVSNVASDKRFKPSSHSRYESHSFMSVPLKISDRIIGVLNISSHSEGEVFRARDLRVLSIFATQAAALIDDAHHFENHRRQLAEQRVLYHIAREVATAERFDQVAGAIYTALREIMPVDFCLWLGWNEVRSLLHHKFVKGERVVPEKWVDFDLSISPEQWADEAGFQDRVKEALQRHVEWKSDLHILTILRILTNDRPQGALILGSHIATRLTEAQQQIATIAGSQAAAVYERHQGALHTTRLATMGNMISEIAHDLKKPLTNLKGSLQLLQQKHPELEESNPFFQSADQEIHHLGNLVRELVEFSNPVRYPLDRVSLHVPLQRAFDLIDSELSRKEIELKIDLTDTPLKVRGQEGEIVQVLLNILHNASDSMEVGGVLSVRTCISQPPDQSEDFAAVTVTDTGCGISQDDRHRVFARHYTTKESGSGLGLAIVERIMQAHNGFVSMQSEVGKGTEFTLFFPLAQ